MLTITELNEKIKSVLSSSMEKDIWICGEVYRYSLQSTNTSGHVYFQLIEQDANTKSTKASIPVIIWAGRRGYIEEKLKSLDSSFRLKDGLEIKVQGYVDYYVPYAKVSFIINDIDVEHTAGKIALKRKQLLEKLKKAGLLDKNKQLPLPLVPLKIGLITSETSAGYNDFINELQNSGYSFSVYLCDSRVQGDQLEKDIVSSIRSLNKTDVDVIAIVRGGGSASDLMGFDNEKVAYAIAKSSKPVLTGIGHQIDNTVADEVAHMSLKTPTAAAKYLIEKVQEYDNEVETAFEQIFEKQEEIIELLKNEINEIAGSIKSNTLRFLERNKEKLTSFNNSLKINSKNVIVNAGRDFLTITRDLKASVRLIIVQQTRQIDNWEIQKNLKDPNNILKKGYSLIYTSAGNLLKTTEQVSAGDSIRAVLADGHITGTVTSKKKGA